MSVIKIAAVQSSGAQLAEFDVTGAFILLHSAIVRTVNAHIHAVMRCRY
jgi:hypothetical protein